MKYTYVFGCIGLLAAGMSAVFALPARAAEPPQVIISELNWGGSARGTADEWFELANTTGAPIDVGGWVVNGIATSGGALALAEGTVIAPHGTLLVANYAMGESSTLLIAPHLVTTAVSIANTKLTAMLAMPDGTVMDSVADPGDPEYGLSSAPFASMERDAASLGWFSATASVNLSDGQLGTPGVFTHAIEVTTAEESVIEIPPTETMISEVPVVEEAASNAPIIDEVIVTVVETPEQTDEQAVVQELAAEEVIIEAVEPIFSIDEVESSMVSEELSEESVVQSEAETIPSVVEPTTENSAPETVTEEVIVPVVEHITVPFVESLVVSTIEPSVVEEQAPPSHSTTGNIVLNELYVRPDEGKDEWVELYNADQHTIDISGWLLRDASGKITTMPVATVAPGEFVVIHNPKGKLNNGEDVIELLEAEGAIIDRIQYGTDALPGPDTSETLARFTDTWSATLSPTAGATNILTQTVTEDPEAALAEDPLYATDSHNTAAAEHNAPASAEPVPTESHDGISTVPEKTVTIVATAAPVNETRARTTSTRSTSRKTVSTKADETVQFTGIIVAAPGTFGSQLAFTNGAALYLHSGDWPVLQVGDVISVEGVWSEARGEKRIKLSSAEAIQVLRHEIITPILATNVTELTANTLVTVEGEVIAREGDTLTLLMHGSELTVVANSHTDVSWSSITASLVRITGVVRATNNGIVLMPRNQNDVSNVVEQPVIEAAAVIATTSGGHAEPIIGGGLLASVLGALGYWFRRSRTLIPQA